MTKFSIIVPVYNAAQFLPQCIDSLINQTYQNIEILLINDGSTDQSPTICEDYARRDDRVKVIHQQNSGQSVARNVGIKSATGDYILFVDSDDWIDTQSCAVFNDLIEKYPRIDVIASKVTSYKDGQVVGEDPFYPQACTPVSGREFSLMIYKENRVKVQVMAYICRREFLIEKNLYFDESLRACEDFVWTPITLLSASSAVYSNFRHYNYVNQPSSLSHQKDEAKLQMVRFALKKNERAFLQIEDDELRKWALNWLITHYHIAVLDKILYKRFSIRQLWIRNLCQNRAISRQNRVNAFLLNIHPYLFYLLNRGYSIIYKGLKR